MPSAVVGSEPAWIRASDKSQELRYIEIDDDEGFRPLVRPSRKGTRLNDPSAMYEPIPVARSKIEATPIICGAGICKEAEDICVNATKDNNGDPLRQGTEHGALSFAGTENAPDSGKYQEEGGDVSSRRKFAFLADRNNKPMYPDGVTDSNNAENNQCILDYPTLKLNPNDSLSTGQKTDRTLSRFEPQLKFVARDISTMTSFSSDSKQLTVLRKENDATHCPKPFLMFKKDTFKNNNKLNENVMCRAYASESQDSDSVVQPMEVQETAGESEQAIPEKIIYEGQSVEDNTSSIDMLGGKDFPSSDEEEVHDLEIDPMFDYHVIHNSVKEREKSVPVLKKKIFFKKMRAWFKKSKRDNNHLHLTSY